MSYYAMVVVVEAPDVDGAHLALPDLDMDGAEHSVLFIGDAWRVFPLAPQPIGRALAPEYVPEFDSLSCIAQSGDVDDASTP